MQRGHSESAEQLILSRYQGTGKVARFVHLPADGKFACASCFRGRRTGLSRESPQRIASLEVNRFQMYEAKEKIMEGAKRKIRLNVTDRVPAHAQFPHASLIGFCRHPLQFWM